MLLASNEGKPLKDALKCMGVAMEINYRTYFRGSPDRDNPDSWPHVMSSITIKKDNGVVLDTAYPQGLGHKRS